MRLSVSLQDAPAVTDALAFLKQRVSELESENASLYILFVVVLLVLTCWLFARVLLSPKKSKTS